MDAKLKYGSVKMRFSFSVLTPRQFLPQTWSRTVFWWSQWTKYPLWKGSR